MADDQDGNTDFSVSVPMSLIAAVAAVVLAAVAAYLLTNQSNEGSATSGNHSSKGKSLGRKVGLRALITLIENDTSRKVVVATLKAMARRA